MEAVVMARPAIRCYSTDLPPLGCDVVHQPVAPALADMILGAGCTTCSSLTHHARRFDLAPSGPCDCHVQDIACLGCGNLVGYYIHRPCFRCLAQRLRIKQRGFQHLWTFYQDNVAAVQRENELGDPVGWEELPAPPLPIATAIRDPVPRSRPAGVIELSRDLVARRSRTPGEPMYSRGTTVSSSGFMPPLAPLASDVRRASIPESPWRQPTGASDQENDVPGRTARGASTARRPALASVAVQADPTPLRLTTQVMSGRRFPVAPADTLQDRRDEVMEPLCPPKSRATRVPPPAGFSNWLFQVGIDCMVKWEEVTLSR
ncbi:hypothetical protein H4R21_002380 [Coemansia helicoidea]|uniref:Uncharacterized protein n=3 Tax=Coemansia TaxID=4863 RepID=A0ACC1L8D0_9FUNG|nr:hypothetical protein H4R21_002380 [Coemansia helicoidea]